MAIVMGKLFNSLACLSSQTFAIFLMLLKVALRRFTLWKMTATHSSELKQIQFNSVQADAHPFCMVCSRSNPLGLGLKFICEADGSVSTTFLGHPALEGFEGLLHGGIIASLLDGAMMNCLFALGRAAMTAELNVRYRQPVVIGEEMRIRAWITRSSPPLHLLSAELKQGGCVKAAATAKFMERS
jgi:acyl-coenzyme A thioesterase PaaI-like protein